VTDLDQQISALCAEQAYDRATTLVLQQVGPSVLRYIAAQTRDQDTTSDAFARFSEDLWRGMRGFRGQSTVRVWAFAIARNAIGQVLRKRRRERERSRAFSSTLANRIATKVRTETLQYLRSETKDRFAQLRQRLSTDEQALLVLRINERMSWEEIASVQLDAPSEATVKREAARLRKRFQLVRDKLRKMAKAEGLLDTGEGGASPRR
jgi:RNA polymerase sigma-70 factor, ECF subfamily